LALASLTYRASEDIEADTIENRTRRVRQLAAQALGAIGDRRALPGLARMMNEANDPRLQVVAAKAVLDIVNRRVVRRAAG
jgi:HEAT repeat protein